MTNGTELKAGQLAVIKNQRAFPLADMGNASLRWLIQAELKRGLMGIIQQVVAGQFKNVPIRVEIKGSTVRVEGNRRHTMVTYTAVLTQATGLVVPQTPVGDPRRN